MCCTGYFYVTPTHLFKHTVSLYPGNILVSRKYFRTPEIFSYPGNINLVKKYYSGLQKYELPANPAPIAPIPKPKTVPRKALSVSARQSVSDVIGEG